MAAEHAQGTKGLNGVARESLQSVALTRKIAFIRLPGELRKLSQVVSIILALRNDHAGLIHKI